MENLMKFILVLFLLSTIFSLKAETIQERMRARMKDRFIARLEQMPAPALSEVSGKIQKPGLYTLSISHNGMARYFKLYVPKTYNAEKPTPLVFSLHGGGGDMALKASERHYKQISTSDRFGYIALIPNGFSIYKSGKLATWNAGNCCGLSRDNKIDDVAFIRSLIERAKELLNIDASKIFASGMSNGGMMSYRLACEMSDTFKAIAAVAGTDNTVECNPKKPISILHIHAKNDDHVLYNGGIGSEAADVKYITNFKSVAETMQKWAKFNKCNLNPVKIVEALGYRCEAYNGCANNVTVQLCTTETGGHSWPGGLPPRGTKDASFSGFSASVMNWEFFSKL